MPSLKNIINAAVALAGFVAALPALPKLSGHAVRAFDLTRRQNVAAAKAGITDTDILQFALTLEFLETAFYQQGFALFPESDFVSLGLSKTDILNLQGIGKTEQVHVTTLLSTIAQSNVQPVAPCSYKFGFKSAADMVAIAVVLENVGVSAYLGAAPLVSSSAVLTVAAEIVTVEARHQTFLRIASKAPAVPSPFDTPLGIRNVFSLASAFITSCPSGSNLGIAAFPPITLSSPTDPKQIQADVIVQLTTSVSGATFCAWTNGGVPGGTAFTPFSNGSCVVPQILSGIVYLNLASDGPLTGVLTDSITIAGPLVVMIS